MPAVPISEENNLIRILVEPRYRWLRHLLLVLLLLVSYNSTMITYMGNTGQLGRSVIYITGLQFLLYIGMVYFNIYILVPRFFLKSRYAAYCFSLLGGVTGLFMGVYLLEYYVHNAYSIEPGILSYVNERHYVALDYVSDIMVTGFCCLGTTLTILFRQWFTDGKRKAEMESQGNRARIRNFKNSVNPVFLSATLDRAAREVENSPEKSVRLLSGLSRYLRYRLYDSARDKVMLNSEIVFLENYLNIRKELSGNFEYSLTSDCPSNFAIPSSVILGVTDKIFDYFEGPGHTRLALNLSACGAEVLNIAFQIESDKITSVFPVLEKEIDNLLRLLVPAGFELTARQDGNLFCCKIKINTTGTGHA